MLAKLEQSRPTDTDAAALRTVSDVNSRFLVSVVNVCNVSAAAANFYLFDASDGEDFDEDAALLEIDFHYEVNQIGDNANPSAE